MEENSTRSNEIKVGLFTVVGLAIIMGIAIFVGRIEIGGPSGYDLKVFFRSADGLTTGNPVRYAGIRAGRVERIELLPNGINVLLRIDPGVNIPADSVVTLGSEGLMGARYVGIQPPENPGKEYLKPGANVQGYSPPGIDEMMASMTKLLHQVEQVVQNVNDIAGSPETKDALKMAIINMGMMSENLRMASESLNRISSGSEADLQMIVQNMRIASGEMRTMIENISDDGKGGEDIRQMLADMRNIVGRMDKITASVETLATDPQTIKDVQQTLKNASEASGKINRLLGGSGSESGAGAEGAAGGDDAASKKPSRETSARPFFQGGMEMSYSPDEREWRGDGNVTLGGDRFVRIGAQDIGEANHLEFQVGQWQGPIAFRAGIFESKLGAGIDWQASDQIKFSIDGYDPNDFHYRLRSELGLGKSGKTSFVAQLFGKRRSTSTYLGIRQQF